MDKDLLRRYVSNFADVMEMRAPVASVASYLDIHQGWFMRCAAPIQAEPLGESGYHLVLGKFGNFGFELEPSIDLELLPQKEGIYRIETIPAPNETQAQTVKKDGYAVDFQASLQLAPEGANTMVKWELDLEVAIRLPAFIGLLPDTLVQSSGDHLLRQIVRQVSRRLTWKVQEDFHSQAGLACPPQQRALF
jgi:hypothetical protein